MDNATPLKKARKPVNKFFLITSVLMLIVVFVGAYYLTVYRPATTKPKAGGIGGGGCSGTEGTNYFCRPPDSSCRILCYTIGINSTLCGDKAGPGGIRCSCGIKCATSTQDCENKCSGTTPGPGNNECWCVNLDPGVCGTNCHFPDNTQGNVNNEAASSCKAKVAMCELGPQGNLVVSIVNYDSSNVCYGKIAQCLNPYADNPCTDTPTATPIPPTATPVPPTPTRTPTPTPTRTPTPTPTATPTPTPTTPPGQPTNTPGPTATNTPGPTLTSTPTVTPGGPTLTPTEIILAKISASPTGVVKLLQTGVVQSFMYFIPVLIMLVGLIL